MKSGDKVQILQQGDGGHWIYAKVVAVNPDGSALVQISHPGNRENGLLVGVTSAQIRNKAAIQKIIDAGPQAAGNWREERRTLESQLDAVS